MGRHLSRPRVAAAHALVFEVSGHRDRRLWIDAAPATAGLYLLTREEARRASAAAEEAVPGSTRHALLLFRKHAGGARVTGLRRIAGDRTVVLEAGSVAMAVRLRGSTPAATLAVDGTAVATLGAGPPAWPLPEPQPAREWDRIEAAAVQAAAREAAAAGRPVHRGIAAACPPLGPLLARELDGGAPALEALRARLRSARPTLVLPRPLQECDDADLAPADAVALVPVALDSRRGLMAHPPSWRDAAAAYLLARRRGLGFAVRQRAAAAAVRRDVARLSQLEANLAGDRAGLPEPDLLRRRAEALLSSPQPLPAGAAEADLADPREPGARLRFAVDPRLSGPANADRLFEKARRIEQARRQVALRAEQARRALAEARAREAAIASARSSDQLPAAPPPAPGREDEAGPQRSGPRRYLTGRGLTILVGRGARENHQLTFATARPEDLWLHARDVPGAHVILRDDEGRAGPDDIREAAEVAAFFSGAREEARADVHVARRKHVRAAGGGAGRVRVTHSDTVRVAPRDPEGRLRKR